MEINDLTGGADGARGRWGDFDNRRPPVWHDNKWFNQHGGKAKKWIDLSASIESSSRVTTPMPTGLVPLQYTLCYEPYTAPTYCEVDQSFRDKFIHQHVNSDIPPLPNGRAHLKFRIETVSKDHKDIAPMRDCTNRFVLKIEPDYNRFGMGTARIGPVFTKPLEVCSKFRVKANNRNEPKPSVSATRNEFTAPLEAPLGQRPPWLQKSPEELCDIIMNSTQSAQLPAEMSRDFQMLFTGTAQCVKQIRHVHEEYRMQHRQFPHPSVVASACFNS